MLLSIRHLSDYKIEATDGSIGQVHSFLFDNHWVIRYLVVETGTLLPGRKVLIVPSALGKPDGTAKVFPVELTVDQIKSSPDIDTEKPVSRQQEEELYKYYSWAPYWTDALGPIYEPVVPEIKAGEKQKPIGTAVEEKIEHNLRSTRELLYYKIHAEDGQIGHVDDFIAHEFDWVIRYIVVDTRKWLTGRKVLIPPDWITDINWENSEVVVNVTKDAVKGSPKFDPGAPVNREYETRFYDYYGRPRYW